MLTKNELKNMIIKVFDTNKYQDKSCVFLVDLPSNENEDNSDWKDRREMVFNWYHTLKEEKDFLDIFLFYYPNVKLNNADLPESGYFSEKLLNKSDEIDEKNTVLFEDIFSKYKVFIAPTEFSATAPLKVAAKKYGFRAATMPGFTKAMEPALRLDYVLINNRVNKLKSLLDEAVESEFLFEVGDKKYALTLDLRFRKGHASGGIINKPGTAGNLPSGEAYIVPYEGENEKSKSQGLIPVQIDDEVVVYKIENNKAVDILSEGIKSAEEKEKIIKEPAYANLAELGLGVLNDFDLKPSGKILLDEKLGLHIAFGRSDHFGGMVGPEDFSSPESVIHLDRVYIPAIQPEINVADVKLKFQNKEITLIKNNKYVIEL